MALARTSFRVGRLGCTCTILACGETNEALVVDPGDEAPRILLTLALRGWTAVRVVHTHAHFDHVLATAAVVRATGAEAALHKADRPLFVHVPRQLEAFGMPAVADFSGDVPLAELVDGESLAFGHERLRVIHTPGHTPGSICLYREGDADEAPLLFAGDTLFAGSVGRTDLWGGNFDALVTSIRGPLFDLPDHTTVVPGHGPETTIAREREDNAVVGKFARRS